MPEDLLETNYVVNLTLTNIFKQLDNKDIMEPSFTYKHRAEIAPSINTLPEFKAAVVTHLENQSFNNVLDIFYLLEQYNGCDFKQIACFSNEKYIRFNVYKSSEVDIQLISWSPQQGSPKHNHPNQGCLMKILEGSLTETRYSSKNVGQVVNKGKYSVGDILFIQDSLGYHVIENREVQPAISLHVYAPGFYKPEIIQ